MSRKDFELIARVINDEIGSYSSMDDPEAIALTKLASEFASALSGTNPRFNCAKFLRACGVPN